jgi:hypothetical protein
MKTCSVEGCIGKHLAKGYCRAHYLRLWRHGSLDKLTMRGEPVLDRIKAKIKINERECWIFTGCLTENGYGHVRDDEGNMRHAHIVTYEKKFGPVPPGLELDHFFCDTRPCCNPDHVAPTTHLENVRRGKAGHDWASRTRDSSGRFIGKLVEKDLI